MTDPNQRVDLTGVVLMNKLRVVRLLGAGGMGAVYEVEHLITRHRRALKVMHAALARNTDTIARFIREAGVAGTLRTPYVVETFDAGQLDDGSPYVLMELLEGRPLGAAFEGDASVGRLVGLICQVLEGLSVAHRAGIVHRDIKPDNVFVGVDERGLERVRILDFGISKFTQGQPDYQGTLTSEGTMMGTPYYMSPEQALGAKDLDARADLYSVGVMLYEGLAGRRPYDAQTLAALVLKIHHGEHQSLIEALPSLPRGLSDAVARAMSVDPAARFASAEEMLAALVPFSDSRFVTSLQTLRNASPQLAVTAVAGEVVGGVAKPVAHPPSSELAARSRAPRYVVASLVVVVLLAAGVGLAVAAGATSGESESEESPTSVAQPAIAQPAIAQPATAPPATAPPATTPASALPTETEAVQAPVASPGVADTGEEPAAPRVRTVRRGTDDSAREVDVRSTTPTTAPDVTSSPARPPEGEPSAPPPRVRLEIGREAWK